MKRLALLLSLSTALFAVDSSDIIWTWGNGDVIASIFSYTYFLLNIDSLESMIKSSAIVGAFIVLVREIAKGEMARSTQIAFKMFMFFAITQATVTFFLTVEQDAKHRVYILSANELSSASWAKCRPVNGDDECYAPIGIKLIYSTLTNFEKAGIASMESAMMDANALTYSFSRMGLGFGFSFFDKVSKRIPDMYAYNTFMEYYENCTIYDFANNTLGVEDFLKSGDLLQTLLATGNSRLTPVYSKDNKQGVLKSCFEVSQTDLVGNVDCLSTAKQIQSFLSGSQASEGLTSDVCDAAQNFGQMMFKSTKDATEQIKQKTTINLANEAMTNSAIASGIDPAMLAYGTAMGDREKASQWMAMGMMAKEWMPSIRGMMQGIAIGLIWILALLSIATASLTPLAAALGFQLTLMVWSFILVLINYMTIIKMGSALPNIFVTELGMGDQMTLFSDVTFNEEMQKALAFLGYMASASYFVAAGLVTIGGNKLAATLGGAMGQLNLGMGNSANMAKGHTEGGLDKSNTDGVQSVNKRGDIDVASPDGYHRTQEARSGFKESSKTTQSTQGGGFNTMTEHTGANGEKSMDIKNQSGDQSITTGHGGVTNAKISGMKVDGSHSFNHSIEEMKSKSATLEKNASDTLTATIGNTSTTAQEFIKGVSKEKGSSAGVDTAKTYNEQVQNNLQKAFESGQMSEDAYNKLRDVKYSAGAQVEASVSGGFTVFGNGIQTKGTATVGATASSTGKHGKKDSISLSEKDAIALSKAMATGLSVTAKMTEGVSDKLNDGVTQKTDTSIAKTNQASHQFSESKKLAETAQKLEKYAESHGVSMSKDLMIDVANAAIYGNEALGIRGNGHEKGSDLLFNNKAYLEDITNKVMQAKVNETIQKVDTDSTFDEANNGIAHSRHSIPTVNTVDPRTVDMGATHTQYSGETKNQGNAYLSNMPETTNAPMMTANSELEAKVKEGHLDHAKQNIWGMATPVNIETKDLPPIKTGQDYKDTQIPKENMEKGENNPQPSMSSQNNPSPQASSTPQTTQNVDKGHDVQAPKTSSRHKGRTEH